MRGSDRFWENNLGRSTGTIPMIKSLVVAAALTIGIAGYAYAQNTITGAPAGTARRHPPQGYPRPDPGGNPLPDGLASKPDAAPGKQERAWTISSLSTE